MKEPHSSWHNADDFGTLLNLFNYQTVFPTGASNIATSLADFTLNLETKHTAIALPQQACSRATSSLEFNDLEAWTTNQTVMWGSSSVVTLGILDDLNAKGKEYPTKLFNRDDNIHQNVIKCHLKYAQRGRVQRHVNSSDWRPDLGTELVNLQCLWGDMKRSRKNSLPADTRSRPRKSSSGKVAKRRNVE